MAGSDASIYSMIRPAPDVMDQFAKAMTIKGLMGQQEMQGLQMQQARQSMADDQGTRAFYAGLQPGEDPRTKIADLLRVNPKAGMAAQEFYQKSDKAKADIAHTTAQTGDITAGHIAGAWGALAKTGGSDQGVRDAEQMMTPLVGAQVAKAVTEKLMALPPEQRLAYAVAQAGTHKTGQEAIKLFFPAAHMQDTGGSVQPVSTSTLPGGPAAGSVVPGGVVTPKTQTPDSIASRASIEAEGALNRGVTMRGQNMTDSRSRDTAGMVDARQREANGIAADGTLTPEAEAMAQGIASGQIAPLSGFALNRPGGRALMGRVMQINPDYRGADYSVAAAGEKGFLSKNGPQIRGFNVVINHLDTAQELFNALKNGDTQLINRATNAFKTQFGQAAPTSLNAAKQFIAAEAVRAVSGAAGALGDREEMAKNLSTNLSDDQFLGTVNTIKDLAIGQMQGHEQQYKSVVGDRGDFPQRFLTDKAASLYAAKNAPPASAPANAAPPKSTRVDSLSQADPAKYKGQVATGDDGIKYKSDGKRWIKQ